MFVEVLILTVLMVAGWGYVAHLIGSLKPPAGEMFEPIDLIRSFLHFFNVMVWLVVFWIGLASL